MASGCCCSRGSLPISYLGLPVGGKMKQLKNCENAEKKFRNKLSSWKARTLSIGGWLTIIKSVLNSLPLYYFSLFRAPKTMINNLEHSKIIFFGWGWLVKENHMGHEGKNVRWFWGWRAEDHKLAWKNLALLGKWWGRFRQEGKSLWARLLASVYGKEGGLGDSLIPVAGGVWPTIIQVGW